MFEAPEGTWEIIPFPTCTDQDQFINYVERPEFIRFLRQFKSDRKVMAHLRGLLTPPYQVALFDNDEVIEIVAWKVAARQLAIRRELQEGQNMPGGGSQSGSGGGGSSAQAPPPEQPQTQANSQQSSSTSGASTSTSSSRRTKSWFAITVVEEVNGAEKPVPDLALVCELPDLGKVTGETSKGAPVVRFDNLNPGGSGAILATSHDDVVWEVTADVE